MEVDPNVDPEVTTDLEAGGEAPPETDETPSGINPAWEPLRQELDPISFSRIEKHLKDIDTAGQQRFTKLNEEFKWAKELQGQGVTPERITALLQFADTLDKSPETIYEQLGQFLKENGRMPSKKELADAVEDEDDFEEDEEDDPRFAQLTKQQEEIKQFLARQEHEREVAVVEAQVKGELQELEASRKDLAREDIGEILRYAAAQTEANRLQGLDKHVTIAEATKWFDSLKNRFLTAPRPGDSAPTLLPTNGGVPSSGQTKTTAQMSRNEVQDLIAGHLKSGKGQ